MKKVYVGNLPYQTSEDEVRDHFSNYGTVVEVALIKDRRTGRPKGFGFVEFETEDQAQKAANEANGQELQGRPLKVNMAREQRDRGDRGGHGGGGRF